MPKNSEQIALRGLIACAFNTSKEARLREHDNESAHRHPRVSEGLIAFI